MIESSREKGSNKNTITRLEMSRFDGVDGTPPIGTLSVCAHCAKTVFSKLNRIKLIVVILTKTFEIIFFIFLCLACLYNNDFDKIYNLFVYFFEILFPKFPLFYFP